MFHLYVLKLSFNRSTAVATAFFALFPMSLFHLFYLLVSWYIDYVRFFYRSV
ncbi:hypothetical protein BCBMB205_07550 [Bacillus sp. CN2]|nr:hypothetical protein BCBMB205_07550 [Bacillus velezensis]ARZ57082.1 hypothetical protein BAGQ_0827 [Bacillus velezensis]GFR57017.1 hypothetical protein BCBMB205_07550 [Bacillus sp. CN2]